MPSSRLSDVLLQTILFLGTGYLVYHYADAATSVRVILALSVAKNVTDAFAGCVKSSDRAAHIKDLEDQIAELGCRISDLLAERLSRETEIKDLQTKLSNMQSSVVHLKEQLDDLTT